MSAHRYSLKTDPRLSAVSAVIYPAGAVVNGDQASTTTVTVMSGHSFAASDKAVTAGDRRSVIIDAVHAMSSIAPTVLTLSTAAQFNDLDYIVNLETETGLTTNPDGSIALPSWDGSSVTVWKDSDKTNAYTNATVPVDSDGEIVFYGQGDSYWVVLIDSSRNGVQLYAGIGPESPPKTSTISVFSATNYATKSYHVIRDGDDVQDVFDSVPAGDADAPTIVYVEPGQHSGVFHYYKNNTSLVGLGGAEQCIFVRESTTGGNNPGAFNIIDPDNLTTEVSNVRIDGICFINQLNGTTGGGNPPEPALSIGRNTQAGEWDNIYVTNCLIIGNHDALQLFGNDTSRGSCYIHNNRILSNHDALTIKCNGHVFSSSNMIVSNDGGVHPMITGQDSPQDIVNWKTTGIHINCSGPPVAYDPAVDRFFSSNDTIHVIGGASSLTGEKLAGIYVYETAGAAVCPSIRVTNPNIFVHWTADAANTDDTVAGIHLDDTVTAAQGAFVVQGGSIEVLVDDQSSAVAEAIGIYNSTDAGASTYIRVIGTHVSCTERTSGTATSAKTTHANANIELNIFSDDAVDGGTGVIAAAPNITEE